MNNNTFLTLGIILSFLLATTIAVAAVIYEDINFEYKLQECSKLNSHASNYDFDLKIEKNVIV